MSVESIRSIVGFCQFVRTAGFNVGIQETIDALETSKFDIIADKKYYQYGLRAIMCTNREEYNLFDEIFEAYWFRNTITNFKQNTNIFTQDEIEKVTNSSIFGSDSQNDELDEEGNATSGASALERLKVVDFSDISQEDLPQLEQLAAQLWKAMSLRLNRKLKFTNRKEKIDLRRTIRRSIGQGGDPVKLKFKGKKKIKLGLIIFLDISGSMDQYSLFFLRFIYALQHNFKRVESFVFSTRLTHVTNALKNPNLLDSLRLVSDVAEAWSSGTRIGECFRQFNEEYAKHILKRNTLVIILSDGLDTGEPDILYEELRRIKRRIKRLVWLNPLIGMENYEPIAKGMHAALPLIDIFISAHNLDSLLNLENVLINAF